MPHLCLLPLSSLSVQGDMAVARDLVLARNDCGGSCTCNLLVNKCYYNVKRRRKQNTCVSSLFHRRHCDCEPCSGRVGSSWNLFVNKCSQNVKKDEKSELYHCKSTSMSHPQSNSEFPRLQSVHAPLTNPYQGRMQVKKDMTSTQILLRLSSMFDE